MIMTKQIAQHYASLTRKNIKDLEAAKSAILALAPTFSQLQEKLEEIHALMSQLPGILPEPVAQAYTPETVKKHAANFSMACRVARHSEAATSANEAGFSILSKNIMADESGLNTPPTLQELEDGNRTNHEALGNIASDLTAVRSALKSKTDPLSETLKVKLGECAHFIQNSVRPTLARYSFDDVLFEALSVYREREDKRNVSANVR